MPALELVKAVKQVRNSRASRASAKRRFSNRLLITAAILLGALSMLAALAALAAAPLFAYITGSLPNVRELPEMFDPATGSLLQPTRFYDRTGEHLLLELQPAAAPRSFVNVLANDSLRDAFVASQDPDFWATAENSWFDLDSGPRGIAEQLTARLLLASEPDGWAKTLRARLLAADAVATYGHEALLNWAINSATFGHWTFGVEAASQLYFAKPAAHLTLAEAALLAAVAQAPALNPHDTPELAIEYQRLVLAAMRDQGMVSDLEFTQAYEQPLAFTQPSASGLSGFLLSALTQIEDALGRERVLLGGLNVTTTLDADLQAEMERLLAGTAATALILDAPNGRVVAAVGAYQDTIALETSELLPFDYLSIFASGRAPADLVWAPGPMTTRQALASSNTTAIAQMNALGAAAEALGLSSGQASLLAISRAYGLLSQNGNLTQAEPSLILFAANETGQIELDLTHANVTTPVSAELAFLVTDVLKDASARSGTLGDLLQSLHYPAALMPGAEAGEFLIGYSPLRVVSIWDQSGVDVELWRQLFEATHAHLPLRDWQVPAGLTSLMVCVPSGQLPDDDCPAVRREWFVTGTEPMENDTLYERVAINAANNTLATVFTPQSFIEERSFLIVPPEAASWARRAGVETPPEDYDTVVVFSGQLGAVSIARPINFSEISGAVAIRAVLATGAEYFDIQVGKGLRPREWTLLIEDDAGNTRSVVTEWDTSGLEGAWTIQLQVWKEDGLLSRAYAIVTIDD